MVLANGRVIEQGSHDELLAANGRYAELFRLQAERFAEDEAESESVDAADLEGDAVSPRTTAEPEPAAGAVR